MWILFFMSLFSIIIFILAVATATYAATAAFAQDESLSEYYPVVIDKYNKNR